MKDRLITWENQAVDYPSTGPEMPEYEPRGCPRGASFSWYQYSPLRLKYPYVRGSLLQMFREARVRLSDPVMPLTICCLAVAVARPKPAPGIVRSAPGPAIGRR